jgi:hypothetical protein
MHADSNAVREQHQMEANGLFIAACDPQTILALLDRAERAEAEVAKAVAAERERCAKMTDQVYNSLSVSDVDRLCGNGRVPVMAYRDACNACATAIRKGDAP